MFMHRGTFVDMGLTSNGETPREGRKKYWKGAEAMRYECDSW